MNAPLGFAQPPRSDLPPLDPGDHLDRLTFHARYEAMPPHVKAELIEGIVYMPSLLKYVHGASHSDILLWLGHYRVATPGTDTVDNTTLILSDTSEPQPDAGLLILPGRGGQITFSEEGYLVGAPELLVEVANSSAAIDLHAKRRDYERAGVREYVVVVLRESRLVWLVRRERGFEALEPGPDGVTRSEVFPGLWLDGAALLGRDASRVLAVLNQGLATPEHAAFVARLRT